jgi:hypothetical protein
VLLRLVQFKRVLSKISGRCIADALTEFARDFAGGLIIQLLLEDILSIH